MDQSVVRALTLLQNLACDARPVRLQRLADQTNLSKSTTHRLLRTLMALGYVEQEEDTARYNATLKLWELGSSVMVEHPIRRAAGPFLQNLHRETGETVSLLLASGDDVLYLDKLVSPRAVRFSTRPGSRVPAPLTAGGKAMLAHNPFAREVLERVAPQIEGRRGFDPKTVLAELDEIRSQGYSVSRANPGVVSFGCALLNKAGVAPAAFSLSAPTERIDDESSLIEALMSTCVRLTETVGLLG